MREGGREGGREEGVKPANQWHIGPGSPLRAQAFVQSSGGVPQPEWRSTFSSIPGNPNQNSYYPSSRRSMSMSMSTLYAPLGSLFQAQGEICETTSYIHQHLQNSKNSAGLNAKVRHQLQRPPMKVNFFSGKNL